MARILDLFCGAGGATAGYVRAGFQVFGVDAAPQKNYPASGATSFTCCDAFKFLDFVRPGDYDAIHASPPCQRYSKACKAIGTHLNHPDLVDDVRQALLKIGTPFIIENVISAPLRRDLTLCGCMFGLPLRKHRIFELHGFEVPQLEHHHKKGEQIIGVYGHGMSSFYRAKYKVTIADWRRAMEIDWMGQKELAEAIPPAYTEYIGKYLIKLFA